MKDFIKITNKRIVVFSFLLCVIIIFVHTLTPLAINTSLLYLAVIFLALLSQDIKLSIYFGVITTMLTWVSLFISIRDGHWAAAVVNRALVSIAIWTTVFIGWRFKKVLEKLWILVAMIESSEESIVGKTKKGIVINWNTGAEMLYGYSAEEMVGKSIEKIFLEDRLKEEEQIWDSLMRGDRIENYETIRRRKDGKIMYVSLKISPIRDFAGNIIGASTITRDITRMKELELRREKHREELEKDIYNFQKEKQKMIDSFSEMEKQLSKKESQLHQVIKEFGRTEEKLVHAEKTTVELESEVQKKNRELLLRNEQLEKEIVDRSRIEKELRESTQRLRELSAYLHSVRENERAMMAREVHDHLGQLLTAIKMDLSWFERNIPVGDTRIAERLKESGYLVNETISSVQRIVAQLRPSILDDLGIVEAIKWQAKEFQKRFSISCQVNVVDADIELSADASTALFRIFQESLTNITRHAQATEVNIDLEKADGFLCLNIKDNGKGMPKDKLQDTKSFGLIGMRERVALFNGHIEIHGKEGQGTFVKIIMPLSRKINKEIEK